MSTPVVFPVGLYLGPMHPGPGRRADHVRVMIGDAVVGLVDGESTLWGRAHEAALTRAELVATDTVDIGRLLGIGAMVEVDPDAPVAFARSYRLRPLQSALGEVAPGRFGIGTAGVAHAVVDDWAHDLWLRCAAAPDLLTACGTAPVLDQFVQKGHTLLAGAAAYLGPVAR